MSERTFQLKDKALKCAINSIANAITPQVANIVYLRWEVFHDNRQFKAAVEQKKMNFKLRNNGKNTLEEND